MARQYYFAPIGGQQGSVATGLGAGLERGVENYGRARSARKAEERQAIEDERRRAWEDAEEARRRGADERAWYDWASSYAAGLGQPRRGPAQSPREGPLDGKALFGTGGGARTPLPFEGAAGRMGAPAEPDDTDHLQIGDYLLPDPKQRHAEEEAKFGRIASALAGARGIDVDPEVIRDMLTSGMDPNLVTPALRQPDYLQRWALQQLAGRQDIDLANRRGEQDERLEGQRQRGRKELAALQAAAQAELGEKLVTEGLFDRDLDRYAIRDPFTGEIVGHQYPAGTRLRSLYDTYMSGGDLPEPEETFDFQALLPDADVRGYRDWLERSGVDDDERLEALIDLSRRLHEVGHRGLTIPQIDQILNEDRR